MADTVIVACTTRNGLIVRLDGPAGGIYELKGDFAVTEIPTAFWDAWKAGPGADFVANGTVFQIS